MVRAIIVLIAVVVGCRREEPVLPMDTDIKAQISRRVTEAMKQPSAMNGLDALFDAISADPRVILAGSALFAILADDPTIAGPLEGMLDKVAEHPDMQAAVAALMQEHPEATPDQIGGLVEQQFQTMWASPPVNEAWLAAFNKFVAKIGTRAEIKLVNTALEQRLARIEMTDRTGQWNARLTALNNGKRPDHARAKELYLQHAWSDVRIQRFTAALAANPVVREETAKAVSDLLALKSLRRDCQAAARTLVADEAMLANSTTILSVLSSPRPSIERVRTSLDQLMTTPVLIEASTTLLSRVVADVQVRDIVDRWFEKLSTDPSVRAEFAKLLDGW
jgi:hypothetical protein